MFWQITPRMLSLLIEREREQRRRADRRAGEAVAILYNVNRDTKKDPDGKTWVDVFPEWKEEPVQTEDQMFASAMLWTQLSQRKRA